MRSITINTQVHEPFEIGALLFATLAYPLLTELEARKRAARAWCAGQLGVTIAAMPGTSDELAAMFPGYAALNATGDQQALRTTARRLRHRMVAAKMMRGYVAEAITKGRVTLPPNVRWLSINELAKLVQPETGESDPENVEKRVWRPSRSVIHLAAAFDLFFALCRPGERDCGYDLQDLEHHRMVVALANCVERILLADKRLALPPAAMVRLRWVE